MFYGAIQKQLSLALSPFHFNSSVAVLRFELTNLVLLKYEVLMELSVG